MSIAVVGLGLWRGSLTLAAMDEMRKADAVVLRTGRCEAAGWLEENGVKYETFDEMYANYDDFSAMYDDMAARLIKMSDRGKVAYAVADLRDESVRRLCRIKDARFVPGPPIDGELMGFCAGAAATVAACDIASFNPKAAMSVVVREIDSRIAASEVKIRLMERYPFDSPLVVASSRGVVRSTLDELDRLGPYDHTVSACVPETRDIARLSRFGTDELRELAKAEPNAPVSLAGLSARAARLAGVDTDDDEEIIAALGAIMLETGLICESARRRGRFSLDDVVSSACETLLNRREDAFCGLNSGIRRKET